MASRKTYKVRLIQVARIAFRYMTRWRDKIIASSSTEQVIALDTCIGGLQLLLQEYPEVPPTP